MATPVIYNSNENIPPPLHNLVAPTANEVVEAVEFSASLKRRKLVGMQIADERVANSEVEALNVILFPSNC